MTELVIWRRASDEKPMGVISVPNCASMEEYDRLKAEVNALSQQWAAALAAAEARANALEQEARLVIQGYEAWRANDNPGGDQFERDKGYIELNQGVNGMKRVLSQS